MDKGYVNRVATFKINLNIQQHVSIEVFIFCEICFKINTYILDSCEYFKPLNSVASNFKND